MGQSAVAVKRLSGFRELYERRFNHDVGSLMRARHKNIVRFLGYCAHTQGTVADYQGKFVKVDVRHRILCFEYLPRGSLNNYITDISLGREWRVCYQIIKGICEGLNYLHGKHIVHLNLKPDNILLDCDMVPKICDFGYSWSSISENEHEMRATQTSLGSTGYLAPEINGGVMTSKTDIYALGVIIVEMLTQKKRCSSFVDVLEGWRNRFGSSSWGETPWEQIKVCSAIGIRCMDIDPVKRPNIQRIIEILTETERITEQTQRIIEMLNGTESMEERIEVAMSTLFVEQTMELNILERIVDGSEEPGYVDLPLLQSITENFSEKKRIGFGGCGEVYEGTLRNGIVAVKRLLRIRTIKDKIFHREVQSLIKIKHQNIVRFLGYCSLTEEHLIKSGTTPMMVDIRERLLCFEYIRNGSLDSYLTDEFRGLEWHKRYEIIMGICKGLLYLHKEKDIIHMDLKPANILLDDHMVPKITDFGLSRLESDSQNATTSRLVSIGYCAPEYVSEGKSSSKSDIYSLGIIIIELVTGKKNKPDITKVLRRWRHRWIKSSEHKPLSFQEVTKCLELGQRCTQHDPTDRPDISDIMDELNKIDSTDDQFQMFPCRLEDMIGIEPLEIHFPFEQDQQVSHKIELINDTDDHFAFMIKPSIRRLLSEPDKGIAPPRSKCSVTVTMMQTQAMTLPNNRSKEEITVLSTRVVHGGLVGMDITRGMFIEEVGKVVDEVNVMVVLGKPPIAEEP
ncbi:unnamed protein product [Urochloa decumbens]|uniref:Protein kinase domain-containing protein n=1 Tax=Urochloa decumbens TaxID=240449 RepID=A0ABC9B080_9POAL